MSLRALAVGLVLSCLPATAYAEERPVVVELFTSQGCSSCPPADAYLTEMSRRRSDVLALAFHVTYWNNLGWRDPFSFEAATERQRRYGERFGDGSYTPEMVVDGGIGLVGSDRRPVEAAIAEAAQRQARTAATVTLSRDGQGMAIGVGSGRGTGRVVLVGFDREHRTAVGRGENSGRLLTESNIVRSLRVVGQWTGAALTLSVDLPEGENAVVLLEAPDGRIVGASRLGPST